MIDSNVQEQLDALRQEASSMAARALALECVTQCSLLRFGQSKAKLAVAVDDLSKQWDANYEQWPEPKPDREQWHQAIDNFREALRGS